MLINATTQLYELLPKCIELSARIKMTKTGIFCGLMGLSSAIGFTEWNHTRESTTFQAWIYWAVRTCLLEIWVECKRSFLNTTISFLRLGCCLLNILTFVDSLNHYRKTKRRHSLSSLRHLAKAGAYSWQETWMIWTRMTILLFKGIFTNPFS